MIESQVKETRELSRRQLCSLDSCLVEKLRTLKAVKKLKNFEKTSNLDSGLEKKTWEPLSIPACI